MPLDRRNGETLDGFDGSMHIVIEPRILAEMNNLLTEYQVRKKFRTTTGRRPIFDDAVARAIDCFAAAGALRPIRFTEDDVLVQVYPKERKAAVLFQRRIAGREFFFWYSYDIPEVVIGSLLDAARKQVLVH